MTCREKTIIQSDQAPAAIGPYSIAVAGGPFVFTSGQLGIIPETNTLAAGGIESETRQALKNLSVVLESANSCLENVVKTTVFLSDMNDFPKVNTIYAEFFNENPPARSTVQVAALPKNAAVEIEAIALTNQEH